MKTLFVSAARYALPRLLALGAFSFPHATQAQQETPVTLETPTAETVRIRIQNPAQQRGSVQVVSVQTGQLLFKEQYAAPAYGHRFDFRNLAAGRYALVVRVGKDCYRYTVQVAPAAADLPLVVRAVKTRQSKEMLASAAQ
ncbi:cupredoxin domain-containing protein [Hymenobacter guriensis]|uniref:Uncharacterized protein n=1 Tax=Hymenobacter guriensis TaxID=2793065 RepID=A0ABS0L8D6_9BACT|nr:hypothetical protein [Hymenobacter guriensis]MBG8556391.1 hypothetical protein [Hymenobacter guriensis]